MKTLYNDEIAKLRIQKKWLSVDELKFWIYTKDDESRDFDCCRELLLELLKQLDER